MDFELKNYKPSILRRTVLSMARHGGSVHIACAFSIIEMLAVLYEAFLGQNDRLVLSKGHGVMASYACLIQKGILPPALVESYFSDGSPYPGLGEHHVPGLDVNTGSLGHGLSVAIGMALARKRKGAAGKIYCLVGDGEMNEGSIWEGLFFAAHHKLSNLVVLVDENKWQAMGRTSEIFAMGALSKKFETLGFLAKDCNGHDVSQLHSTLKLLSDDRGERPRAIVCDTVKGYGVSFMSSDNRWHYTRLDDDTFEKAMAELKQ